VQAWRAETGGLAGQMPSTTMVDPRESRSTAKATRACARLRRIEIRCAGMICGCRTIPEPSPLVGLTRNGAETDGRQRRRAVI